MTAGPAHKRGDWLEVCVFEVAHNWTHIQVAMFVDYHIQFGKLGAYHRLAD